MDNKGFAVTTLLYGLTIIGILLIGAIMASIATTRNNMREISDKVEEDLINYTKSYNTYTEPSEYTFKATEDGFYRIEAWGPQGGTACDGEKGSYATGIIRLTSATPLKMTIGRCGESTKITEDGDSKYIMYVDSVDASNYINGQSEYANTSQSNSTSSFFADGYRLSKVHTGSGKIRITKVSPKSTTSNYTSLPNKTIWKNGSKIQIKQANSCMLTAMNYSGANKIKRNTKSINSNDYVLSITGTNKGLSSILITCTTPPTNNIEIYIYNGTTPNLIYNGKYYSYLSNGIQLSAYQQPATTGSPFPSQGNYYIIPIKQSGKVVTATSPDLNFSPVEIGELDGSNSQRWSIESSSHTNGQYKFVETSTYRALDIQNDENYLNEKITAKRTFNTLSKVDSQHWTIHPNNDGTYSIKTILPKKLDQETGYITIETDRENEMGIGAGSSPSDDEKFIIYSLDFSSFSS